MAFILKRAAIAAASILAVSIAVFALQSFSYGDSSYSVLAEDASREDIERYLSAKGLDRPLWERYPAFIASFFSGDWGETIGGRDIREIIRHRLPVTVSVSLLSLAMASLLSFSLVYASFLCRKPFFGKALEGIVYVLSALPSYLIALLLVLAFSLWKGIFPVAGYVPPSYGIIGHLRSIFLPSLTLALMHSSHFIRMMLFSVRENLESDHVLGSRSLMLRDSAIILKEGFRPSLVLFISLLWQSVGTLAAGSAVVETVFALPGIGSLFVDAALKRDAQLSSVIVMLIAIAVSLSGLLSALCEMAADPRLRRSRQDE